MNLIDIVAILPYFITLATREDEKTLVQADLSEDKDTNKESIQTLPLNATRNRNIEFSNKVWEALVSR